MQKCNSVVTEEYSPDLRKNSGMPSKFIQKIWAKAREFFYLGCLINNLLPYKLRTIFEMFL